MPEPRVHLLIAGVSTRALAASAARAGYRVTAVDAFGDLDLRAVAEVLALRRDGVTPYGADAAAEAARSVSADAVAYTSNFENHPEAVAVLAAGRRLLGNPPEVLERVRNPIGLMRALRRLGFVTPATRASPPTRADRRRHWLVKPRRSGGGHGTARWAPGRAVPRRSYLQEWIAGVPGSIAFVADGRRAVPVGYSRQLVGDRAFGAEGFRYCGSLLASARRPIFEAEERLLGRARALASAITGEFGLRGLNGIDFMASHGVPYPIEVNPRYSASMELVEQATALPLFELHAQACGGVLPSEPRRSDRVLGKAIVFARRNVTAAEPEAWLPKGLAADLPHPGERIGRGHPICTIFGEGRDAASCHRTLVARAGQVYRAVEPRVRGAA